MKGVNKLKTFPALIFLAVLFLLSVLLESLIGTQFLLLGSEIRAPLRTAFFPATEGLNRWVAVLSELQFSESDRQKTQQELAATQQELVKLQSQIAVNNFMQTQTGDGSLPEYISAGEILEFLSYPKQGYFVVRTHGRFAEIGDWVAAYGYILGTVSAASGDLILVKGSFADDTELQVLVQGTPGVWKGNFGAAATVSNLPLATTYANATVTLFAETAVIRGYLLGKLIQDLSIPSDPAMSWTAELPFDLYGLKQVLVIDHAPLD